MARRKYKRTLFDVINTGQPVGLQHRQRVPSYQPTPELPVTKKLAKLLGRKSGIDKDRPLSAAEQLEQLRRELTGDDLVTKASVIAPEPARVYAAIKEDDEAAVEARPVRTPARSRIAELAEAEEAAERSESPRREPRRPLGAVLREQWTRVEPKVSAAGTAIATRARYATVGGWKLSKVGLGHARELGGRYGVTAAAAAGVIVVLFGAFYAGKTLFTRPAVPLAGNELVADGTVRGDVLGVDNRSDGARANEAIANVSNNATQTKLEKKADAPKEVAKPAASDVFGGRRLDLNYVILQSYTSEADANAAAEVLAKYDIKTTVERNLPRWGVAGKTVYSVVSVESFAKVRDDEVYQAFIKTAAKISEKEAGTTLPRRLDPLPYRYTPATPK